MRPTALLAFALIVSCVPVAAQPAPPVPVEYQDLYGELSASVASFRSTIEQQWNGTRSGVAFSANLASADSTRGPALLGPSQGDGVRLELDSLKALGVKAVTLDIDFPMLYLPFHGSQAVFQQYLTFYQDVARDVRARGLTLIVETQAMFTGPGYGPWDLRPYYASLSLGQFERGRAEVARVIAENLRPDYLSVVQEPDSEAAQTGKPELGTLDGSAAQLTVILSSLQAAGVLGVAVGAGFGTWQPDYASWADRFATSGIDFLDMHVYPANRDFLPRAFQIADIARSHGKRVGMTEAWLYKVRDSELLSLGPIGIMPRDVYSFWAPLDAQFLQTMVEYAECKRLDFMSAFWSGYLRAYVDYGPATRDLPPEALNLLAVSRQTANLLTGTYSSTGLAYKDAIVQPPDMTPPAAPANLSAQLTSATSAIIRWSPAADDVGTAAYQVFRDGLPLGRTAMTFAADSSLAEARTYTYAVVASDASGHESWPATASITTPDTTSPSIPAGLIAVAVTSGSRIDVRLSWWPSVDNVAVTSYRVYRGTSPGALSLLAITDTPSFTITNARPRTTWWFAVSAVDAAWNDSGQSSPAGVTTPAAPDLTPPTVEITFPADGALLSRMATFDVAACDVRGGLYDDPSGVAGVQLRIDGADAGPEQTVPVNIVGACGAYRLSYDTRRLSDGLHAVTAVARDRAGNRASAAPMTVRVRNR